MSHQVVTVFPAELWLEIFANLFDDLVDEWQFEAFRNCSLVCKEFYNILNWKIVQGDILPNLWKLLAFKHSIPIPTLSADEVFLDMRKIFCQFIIPTELSTLCPGYHDGLTGYYKSSGFVKCFFESLKFGIGILRKMIKIDESILELFKDFIKKVVDQSAQDSPHPEYALYNKTELIINGNLPFDKYERLFQIEYESYYPVGNHDTFEVAKKENDVILFEFLKSFIQSEENNKEECEGKITEIQVLREYITRHCPIVVGFKDIYIGMVFSFAQVFITREGKCIFFEFSAD